MEKPPAPADSKERKAPPGSWLVVIVVVAAFLALAYLLIGPAFVAYAVIDRIVHEHYNADDPLSNDA